MTNICTKEFCTAQLELKKTSQTVSGQVQARAPKCGLVKSESEAGLTMNGEANRKRMRGYSSNSEKLSCTTTTL